LSGEPNISSHSLALKLIWYFISTESRSSGVVTERSGAGEVGVLFMLSVHVSGSKNTGL
jgi:hypothetical protein